MSSAYRKAIRSLLKEGWRSRSGAWAEQRAGKSTASASNARASREWARIIDPPVKWSIVESMRKWARNSVSIHATWDKSRMFPENEYGKRFSSASHGGPEPAAAALRIGKGETTPAEAASRRSNCSKCLCSVHRSTPGEIAYTGEAGQDLPGTLVNPSIRGVFQEKPAKGWRAVSRSWLCERKQRHEVQ